MGIMILGALLKSTWLMAAKIAVILGLLLLVSGCSGGPAQNLQRIALLGPFEGRYREIGYDAYYAARLAVSDHGSMHTELLAIDDGGSQKSAAERAAALSLDPNIRVVMLIGNAAASLETQQALGAVPALIIGQWNAQPADDKRFMLTSSDLANILGSSAQIDEITGIHQNEVPEFGNELFSLKQLPHLKNGAVATTIVSSGTLPDPAFRNRLLSSALYVPEPGLLSTLSYDATRIALLASEAGDPMAALRDFRYEGLNGIIRFENGFWANAPIHYYRFDSNCLQRNEEMCLIPLDNQQ